MSQEEEQLAKAIADELMSRIYKEIGKSVFKWMFWIGMSALIAFAVMTGSIKLP